MEPRRFLRAEGLAALIAALATYVALDGPLPLLVVLALAPDLSMLGYLAGSRAGSLTYNLAHTYVLPLALGGVGVHVGAPLAVQIAAIWAGHIGADRFAGYGLEFPSGFRDTHLNRQPAPHPALVDDE